jgi:hypothetical protein
MSGNAQVVCRLLGGTGRAPLLQVVPTPKLCALVCPPKRQVPAPSTSHRSLPIAA